jgi:diguanylate cyclase (GGDEF)-like protein
MLQSDFADDHRNVLAPRRAANRLIAALLVVIFCFCAICAKFLVDAHNSAWQGARETTASLVAAIELDILLNIESFDLSLQAVVDNLNHPGIDRIDPDLRQLVLFDLSATARHLDAILVVDETGHVRFDSRTIDPKPASRTEREYFQFHQNNGESGLHVGGPIVAKTTGQRVVTLSRRLSHPDGSFAGVVVGGLRLSYFQELFKNISLGPNDNITLSSTDGTLLMRWPYKEEFIGRDLKGADLYKHLAHERTGSFDTIAVTDGVRRLVGYRQIGDLPLVVGVGRSTADIFADWRQYAFSIGLLVAALWVVVIYLIFEIRQRGEAEINLAVLATTDELTGLANRRKFDETLAREWRRAMREHQPLALMMLDADLFKEYNDYHGHQAGDRLLQTIGQAMAASIQRTTDLATRYGGDEFSILLPGTPVEGATRVAERVRERLAELCRAKGVREAKLSIGIAAVVPESGENYGVLLAAVDQALYRAKEAGRDRIEKVQIRRDKPILIAHTFGRPAA